MWIDVSVSCLFVGYLIIVRNIWVEIIAAFMQLQREFQSINKDEHFLAININIILIFDNILQ